METVTEVSLKSYLQTGVRRGVLGGGGSLRSNAETHINTHTHTPLLELGASRHNQLVAETKPYRGV